MKALCPSQMTPPHSYRDNFYTANHSIHTPISVTNNLDQLVSLTQPMNQWNFFFFFLNDRILLIFNVLLTLGHTWKFFKGKDDLTSLCYLNLKQVIKKNKKNKKILNQDTNNCLALFFAEY